MRHAFFVFAGSSEEYSANSEFLVCFERSVARSLTDSSVVLPTLRSLLHSLLVTSHVTTSSFLSRATSQRIEICELSHSGRWRIELKRVALLKVNRYLYDLDIFFHEFVCFRTSA